MFYLVSAKQQWRRQTQPYIPPYIPKQQFRTTMVEEMLCLTYSFMGKERVSKEISSQYPLAPRGSAYKADIMISIITVSYLLSTGRKEKAEDIESNTGLRYRLLCLHSFTALGFSECPGIGSIFLAKLLLPSNIDLLSDASLTCPAKSPCVLS